MEILYFYVILAIVTSNHLTSAYHTCYSYKISGHDVSGTYDITLPSGIYQVYCEMGINGGGYTFISPFVLSKLHKDDIKVLLNGKTKAKDILLRISKLDGSQPYTVIEQYIDTGGFIIDIGKDHQLGKFLYVGVFHNLKLATAGMVVNSVPLTYSAGPACGTFSGYYYFYVNEKEGKPSDYHANNLIYERVGFGVNWRAKAIRPYSTRRIPVEYFMLTVMGFGCGVYTSSDRWITANQPALGTAIGLR